MPTTETARVPEDLSGRLRRLPVGGMVWKQTFRALRHRNYRLFFWGQLVSLIGTKSKTEFPSQCSFRDLEITFHLMQKLCQGGPLTVFHGEMFAHGLKFFGKNND